MERHQVTTDKPYFVVSHYNEDISWLINQDVVGTLFVRGKMPTECGNLKIDRVKNIGGNQYDIISFIYNNYDNLPDIMCFTQGYPFDHCEKATYFDKIGAKRFSSLETYGHLRDRWGRRASLEIDRGFSERNTSWYIFDNNDHLLTNGVSLTCSFNDFDSFMSALFVDYKSLPWIRFCPGSQYIVENYRCTNYSKDFWKRLLDFFPTWTTKNRLFPTECFLIERALWYVFSCVFHENFECNLNPVSTDDILQKHNQNKIHFANRSFLHRMKRFCRQPDRAWLLKDKLTEIF